MEFHEEIEYLIEILKKPTSNISDIDALERLEKILEEYAKKNQQQKVQRNYF
ncbi:hypothetical protein [Pelosinus sp. sgz500959]|uniref:hypothetical protein n=1 Tax=Pelosinus sp. sgz500959 TaxID=3242472 RepID=UPI003671381C